MKDWKEWKSVDNDDILVTVNKKQSLGGNDFNIVCEIINHYESQGYKMVRSNIYDYYSFKKVKEDVCKPTETKYMLIRKDEKEPLGYFNTKEEARLELARHVKTDLENDKFVSNIYEILRVEPTE